MDGQVDVRHALERTRAVRPGGAAREPENGQQGGQDEVGHRELGLVLVHLVDEAVDGNDEEAVEHGQHAGRHKELAVRGHVAGDVNRLLAHIPRPTDLLRVRKRVVDDGRHVGHAPAHHGHLHLKVGGRGKGADGKDLKKG